MLTIKPETLDDLALTTLIGRTRRFLAEQSPSFARTDPDFQQTFMIVQAEQMAALQLRSQQALPSLALAAWELGLADWQERPDLTGPLREGYGDEATRLAQFRELVGRALSRRAAPAGYH